MTDRELDALIAEKVMGERMPPKPSADDGQLAMIGSGRKSLHYNWVVCVDYEAGDIPYWEPRNFSTDRNASARALERIEELGMQDRFINILWNNRTPWQLLKATPRQLMEVALECVGTGQRVG